MARKSLTTLKSEKAVAKGLQGMLMGDTQPETDKEGMTWFNKTNEITYIAVKNEAEVIEWKPMSGGTDTGGGTGGGASVTVSETAPASPSEGDLWMDSSSTQLYIYYNDGTTSQWVQTTATPTSAGASISVSSTPPALPTQGQVWWDSETANLYVAYNDGTGTQWIQSSSSPVTPTTDDATVGTEQPTPAVTGMLWYDTVTSELKVYDGTEWQVAGGGSSSSNPAPTVESVSPLSYNGDADTAVTITGTNFTLGAQVKFITHSGVAVDASVVSVTSTTTITAQTPQAFLESDGPLDIRVTLPDGQFAGLPDAIQTGGSPTWTTAAGTLYQNAYGEDITAGDNSYRLDMDVDETIAATDPDGQTVTYSVESGALPTGTSLDPATGNISGTLPSSLPADTTYTFTAGASDTAGNTTTRSFNIIVKNQASALYNFSSFIFDTTNKNGREGPTRSALLAWYDTGADPWLLDTSFFTTDNGIQIWTVPKAGTYEFTLGGANGGKSASYSFFGKGALVSGRYNLTKGEKLKILVGQPSSQGLNQNSRSGGGAGGGGTFVAKHADNTALFVAGGAGGCANYSANPGTSLDGRADSPNGPDYVGQGRTSAGHGGGSYNVSGEHGSAGGQSFISGGLGGLDNTAGGGNDDGGFGGGGSHGDSNNYAAGGGGYEGGSETGSGGAIYEGGPGGGGSYAISTATNRTLTAGGNNGNTGVFYSGVYRGFCKIQLL